MTVSDAYREAHDQYDYHFATLEGLVNLLAEVAQHRVNDGQPGTGQLAALAETMQEKVRQLHDLHVAEFQAARAAKV
ncbi:MAG: hypothetical protein Q7J44_06215 [Pseudotabrizicola sp.]|uniref:hypothetical protein n=1 Tax=Pseudotabrizicola sp. TaxID=2939647 RepID=UPI002726285F|nr:hypothetical protein [Pseudotabrizicola sp.]MDO9638116.1 hypothetical protein [Pseudotabrizicola sp.]